jgi:hypothetical protein
MSGKHFCNALFVLMAFAVGNVATAQEMPGKCSLVFIDGSPWPPRIVHSDDAKYLARVPGKHEKGGIRIYREIGSRFVFVREVHWDSDEPPEYVLISNDGVIATIGERSDSSQHIEPDELTIYARNGSIAHVVTGDQVLSEAELQESRLAYQGSWRCTPPKPWVCWEYYSSPEIVYSEFGAEISLLDTLGNVVYIGLGTGSVRWRHRLGSSCKMFDDYDRQNSKGASDG